MKLSHSSGITNKLSYKNNIYVVSQKKFDSLPIASLRTKNTSGDYTGYVPETGRYENTLSRKQEAYTDGAINCTVGSSTNNRELSLYHLNPLKYYTPDAKATAIDAAISKVEELTPNTNISSVISGGIPEYHSIILKQQLEEKLKQKGNVSVIFCQLKPTVTSLFARTTPDNDSCIIAVKPNEDVEPDEQIRQQEIDNALENGITGLKSLFADIRISDGDELYINGIKVDKSLGKKHSNYTQF